MCGMETYGISQQVLKKHRGRKSVLVLYTGGTIGMKENNEGELEPEPRYLVETMKKISLLNDPEEAKNYGPDVLALPVDSSNEKIIYDIKEYTNIIDSSNISAKHWEQMASDIENNYQEYDGFVILHGTDTMAYTSSALAFMLENLTKPVIVTGAQEPLCRVRSDGVWNMQLALLVAGGAVSELRELCEVTLLLGRRLLRGCCACKASLCAFDAFTSPNATPIASFQADVLVGRLRRQPQSKFKVHSKMSERVGILYFHPGISANVVRTTMDAYDGVVLVTFGTGNICSDRKEVVDELRAAVGNGRLLVVVSGAREGRLRRVYAAGAVRSVPELLLCDGLTLEAAFTKLCFVLAQENLGLQRKRQILKTDLCGEMAMDDVGISSPTLN